VPLALIWSQTLLLVVAALFICFALIVALVVPRSNPNFPGKRLGLFIAVALVFFAAQITAVFVLAESEGGEGETEAVTTAPETLPAETETTPGTTEPVPTETTTAPEGDPVAGKAIFTGASGCFGCHTLADANATGTVGPNLDKTTPPFDLVVERATNGKPPGMPAFSSSLSEQDIRDVAAYVSSVAGS
jgi:mono/diheme cytochrome c family protein